MNITASTAAHRWLQAARRKMPIGQRTTGELYFVAFALSAVAFLLPLSGLLLALGFGPTSLLTLASTLGVCISILVWKLGKRVLPAMLLFQLNFLATILCGAGLHGGVTSPALVWLGIVPLLMLFVVSRAWCNGFLMLCLGAVLAFFVLQSHGWLPIEGDASLSELQFAALMHCVFILTQMLLVTTIEGVNLQQIRRMERNNRRLNLMASALERANAHKDRFLSSVSHEMRTPLNGVHGYLALLQKRTDLPAQASEQIGNAYLAASHLLTLINDLLDYSQIRQGKFALTMQPTQLPGLLRQVHRTLEGQASEKGLDWRLEGVDTLPTWVRIDPHRLTQMLLNLLGNAIKFTDRGHVSLLAHYEALDGDSGRLTLTVQDSGCGMDPDRLGQIFEPFVQLHSQNPANGVALRGNGLGLAITQALLTAWGGQIRVSSQPGQGSTFCIDLPIRTGSPAPEPVRASDSARVRLGNGLRILLVDDHTMNRMVARATLQREAPDCVIEEAANGQEALQKMCSERFDLVLLDIVMPDISGIEVLRRVRSQCPAPFSSVPVLAFTANLAADVAQECRQAGFSGLIPKPFDADALVASVQQLTATSRSGAQPQT